MSTENAPGPHGGNRGGRMSSLSHDDPIHSVRWVRASRSLLCPICRKPNWCGISSTGQMVICMRTESPRSTCNGGYLHRLGEARPVPPMPMLRSRLDLEFQHLHLRDLRRAAAMGREVDMFAEDLGVDAGALVATQIGWSGRCWSWPMHDGDSRVIGLRLRDPHSGGKFAVRGSREGLFLPASLGAESETLFIVEGPTDLAALITLGEFGIGRPSCCGGEQACERVARGRNVVIISDSDEPGRRGAARLAAGLLPICPDVRVIEPPTGIKDLRDWVKRGATREDLGDVVAAARPMKIIFEGGHRG